MNEQSSFAGAIMEDRVGLAISHACLFEPAARIETIGNDRTIYD
jgi:hypothetical protein